jgi:hypothetical protein
VQKAADNQKITNRPDAPLWGADSLRYVGNGTGSRFDFGKQFQFNRGLERRRLLVRVHRFEKLHRRSGRLHVYLTCN